MTTTIAMASIAAIITMYTTFVANPRATIAKNRTDPAIIPTTRSMKKVGSLKKGCSTLG